MRGNRKLDAEGKAVALAAVGAGVGAEDTQVLIDRAVAAALAERDRADAVAAALGRTDITGSIPDPSANTSLNVGGRVGFVCVRGDYGTIDRTVAAGDLRVAAADTRVNAQPLPAGFIRQRRVGVEQQPPVQSQSGETEVAP